MVYYKRWEEFASASAALYEASPVKTRYCVRWRHEAGLLVLKVTDDRTCIKFKTRSAVFLNRFELLNRSLL
ncbi:signal recognition particle, SRP9/SRP14 subunit, partial [Leucosporidium creatinivorum]